MSTTTTLTAPAKPTNVFLATREGHAGLFFRSISTALSSTSVQRRSPALPLELFLEVMGHVRYRLEGDEDEDDDSDDEEEPAVEGEQQQQPAESANGAEAAAPPPKAKIKVKGGEADLIRASQVCFGWRNAIVGCGRLWSELRDVRAASFSDVERVRAVAERSKGSLRHLSIHFRVPEENGLPLSSLPAVVMLKQILREVSVRDGARKLETLEVDLKAFRYCEDAEVPFNIVALVVQFAEFSAVNLRQLRILTCLDRFPAGAPFFFALPQLKKLVVTSSKYDPAGGAMLPSFYQTQSTIEAAQASSVALRTLVLSGTCLMDGNYPAFPELRVLKLFEVKCSNLYGLLTKCASTLEKLVLRRVAADPSNRYLPPPPGGGDKDLAPVLDLPRLDDLQLAGAGTPVLYIAPTATTSHFVVSTPVLRRAVFSSRTQFDPQVSDDGDPVIEAVSSLTTEALSTLFRNSTWLSKLDLSGSNVTAEMLESGLPFASSSLTWLSLGETPAATDSFIDHLHSLAPQLEWLDVFAGRGAEHQVTVQALARFAQRVRGEAPSADWELTMVTRQPHTSDPTLAHLRLTLRNLLVALSDSQLEHLISSSLVLNSPPGALPFTTVKSDVLALGQPAPPLGASTGFNGLIDGLGGEKKKKKPVPRPAAPQNIVDEAAAALKAWQLRKEEDLAVAWGEAQDGVELRWGTEVCEEKECSCKEGYPGWDAWHDEDGAEE
ncbi:hypothetical protein JCM8097_004314 [Rhodosporidiobolus ruineniae]